MTVTEAIRNRRSIRKYSARPVEDEKLAAVLEAARLAPSAANKQNWKFIAVRDPALRVKLTEACGGQKFVGEAPVILVACATELHTMTCGQPADTIDPAIAMSFMLLAAAEQGLGTCWLGFFYEEKVKAALGIPSHMRVVAVSPLGYPAENPAARARKGAEEVISYNRF